MSRENITFYPSKTASLNITQLAPLAMSAYGLPVKTIAYRLGKADPTIVHHLVAAREHYGARNNIHAVAMAIACGDIKFKIETSYTSTLRCGALFFGLLAGVISIIDTPFAFDDTDHSIVRHVRTLRSRQGTRGTRRDNALDQFFV